MRRQLFWQTTRPKHRFEGKEMRYALHLLSDEQLKTISMPHKTTEFVFAIYPRASQDQSYCAKYALDSTEL